MNIHLDLQGLREAGTYAETFAGIGFFQLSGSGNMIESQPPDECDEQAEDSETSPEPTPAERAADAIAAFYTRLDQYPTPYDLRDKDSLLALTVAWVRAGMPSGEEHG